MRAAPTRTPFWQVESGQLEQHIHGPAAKHFKFENESVHAESVVLQWTLKGYIEMNWEDDNGSMQQRQAHPGTTLLFGGHEPGGRIVPKNVHYVCHWIRLRGTGLLDHWAWLRHRYGSVPNINLNGSAMNLGVDIIGDFLAGTPITSDTVSRLVHLLGEELSNDLQARQSPIDRAIGRLRQRPYQPWSLKTIASNAGCSREHLSRVFQERYGEPPATWLRERRLKRAVHLLTSTEIGIANIAKVSGFSSTDTLGRLVQQRYGLSCSRLRQGADEEVRALAGN